MPTWQGNAKNIIKFNFKEIKMNMKFLNAQTSILASTLILTLVVTSISGLQHATKYA